MTMHASNGPIAQSVAAEADPIEVLMLSLKNKRGAEAVSQLLDAIGRQLIVASSVREFFRKRGGEDLIPDMIHALAWHACPHCKNGFDQCLQCGGSGHGEEPGQACIPCGGVGVTTCDFCGGSGVITYDAIPRDLRMAVAVERSNHAMTRVQNATQQSLPRCVAADQISATRKSLLRRNFQVRRDLALLMNAAQFARQFRREDPAARSVTCDLFRSASRSAGSARHLASKLYTVLAQLSRVTAKLSRDADTQSFEQERATAFEMHARMMSRWSRCRASLFPGH
jgi:hypothetical protein